MADTQKQNIKDLQNDVGTLKTDVAVMKNDLGYIKDTSKRMDDFIESNKGGITTASILNNKIVTITLGGIVAAGIYFAAKGGL